MQYLKHLILDKGFVSLVSTMGDDKAIADAARVSTGSKGNEARDAKLIAYLYKHSHMTPFEMCEAKFHIKAPLFITRQWMRHRAGSFNEASARYKELEPEFYIPSPTEYRTPHPTNKQASGGLLHASVGREANRHVTDASYNAWYNYKELLNMGVVREQARMVLPTNIYTEFYWKVDLRNLLGFLALRNHEGAQSEIQAYARAIQLMVRDWVPVTAREAFAHEG